MKFYTRHEVAEMFDVKLATLDKWRREGDFPAGVKFPSGTVRYTDDILRRFAESNEIETLNPDRKQVA